MVSVDTAVRADHRIAERSHRKADYRSCETAARRITERAMRLADLRETVSQPRMVLHMAADDDDVCARPSAASQIPTSCSSASLGSSERNARGSCLCLNSKIKSTATTSE